MKQIRLLPVVVLAASALLLLKGFGLVTGGGYVLTGTMPALAQDAAGAEAEDDLPLEDALSEAEEAAAARAADNLFAAPPDEVSAESDPAPVMLARDGGTVPYSPGGIDAGEALLERLTERRLELDGYAEELEMRAALVAAAEQRLEERMAELAALEAEINALVDTQVAINDEQFSALVAMYEAMRPRDAAAVFDGLAMEVLIRVARAMNPRRMSPILAQMQTGRAQELTLRLAVSDAEPARAGPDDGYGDLPQIVGQ